MKESILIENFGPLKKVNITDIRPFTVLIGESASGKSTLLKVLILMRYIYKMQNIRAYLRNAGIVKSPFRFSFLNLLSPELKSCLSPQSYISYEVEIDGQSYAVSFSGKDKKLKTEARIMSKHLSFFKEAFVAETRSVLPQWLERGGSIRGKSLDFYFQQTFEEFDHATDIMTEQDLSFVGFKLSVNKSGNKGKKLFIDAALSGHSRIELRQASSGVQTSAPLMMLVRYFSEVFSFKDAFQRSVLSYLFEADRLTQFKPEVELQDMQQMVHLHIEEPELSLYPEAQRKLVNQMIATLAPTFEKNSQHPWQVSSIIATHSPYLINQLNVLFEVYYAQQEGRSTISPLLPALNPQDTDVFIIANGEAQSLKRIDNDTEHEVIDTFTLSEPLDNMVNDYFQLRGEQANG